MMKKIKATEIVLFVCLLLSCFVVPRFVTGQILSGVGEHYTIRKAVRTSSTDYLPGIEGFTPKFPVGGWFEQAIRVGLIGLTVFYAFRVAKRIDRQSSPPAGENKGS